MLETLSIILILAFVLLASSRPMNFGMQLAGVNEDLWHEKPERKPWQDLLMFKKGGGGSAPSPDPQIGKAALLQAQTGQDWLDFAKMQFEVGNERQEGIDALTKNVTTQQLDDMKKASARSDDQWGRYNTLFKPIEDRMVSDAANYDSPEAQAKAAAEAKADVMSNASQSQQQNQRQMASMGIDPRSGRYAAIDRGTDLATALASAGAQNGARDQVKATGMALREGVANFGRGNTATAAQQVGLGLNAGNSATGNTNAANSQWQANNSNMNQGFSGAMQGYAGQANTLNTQYGNQLNAWSAQQQANSNSASGLMSGIGSLVGGGAALYSAVSSKDYKENKRPVEGALEAVDNMPVEQWSYKEGIADGGEHIGPYAEDFQKATGKGDGKSIPLMDAIGVTMKAVQELNQKVEGLTGAKKNPMAEGIA